MPRASLQSSILGGIFATQHEFLEGDETRFNRKEGIFSSIPLK